jgi:hypothetical protein
MDRRRCAACGELFTPRRNVPGQKYCSKPECQRERRRRWQRQKLKEDPDYRANQAAAQRRWRERHPEYWRRYRQTHPAYTERNRKQQRKRNRNRAQAATGPSAPAIAKMDAYKGQTIVASGTYRLIPVSGRDIAKMDAYLVEMQVLSRGYGNMGGDCKERTR